MIVVDDGSDDSTGQIVLGIAESDPRLRLVRFERNRGVSAARNFGLDAAQGDFVAFLDADDALAPGAIEYLVSLAEESDTDLIRFSYSRDLKEIGVHGPSARRTHYKGRSELSTFQYSLATGRELGSVWLLFARGSVMRRVRFPEGVSYREDLVFNLRLLNDVESLLVVDDPLYLYRRNPQSVTISPEKIVLLVSSSSLASDLVLQELGRSLLLDDPRWLLFIQQEVSSLGRLMLRYVATERPSKEEFDAVTDGIPGSADFVRAIEQLGWKAVISWPWVRLSARGSSRLAWLLLILCSVPYSLLRTFRNSIFRRSRR